MKRWESSIRATTLASRPSWKRIVDRPTSSPWPLVSSVLLWAESEFLPSIYHSCSFIHVHSYWFVVIHIHYWFPWLVIVARGWGILWDSRRLFESLFRTIFSIASKTCSKKAFSFVSLWMVGEGEIVFLSSSLSKNLRRRRFSRSWKIPVWDSSQDRWPASSITSPYLFLLPPSFPSRKESLINRAKRKWISGKKINEKKSKLSKSNDR